MSRHINKQNRISAQLSKKPYDCIYERKAIRAVPNDRYRVNPSVADDYNEKITEILKEIPKLEAWLLLRKVFIELGIRKES